MLQGTPAEPPPLIYHITPTSVYAGWSKIYIRRIAAPIAQTIRLIHVIIRNEESHQYNLHVELSGRLGKGIGEHRKLIFVCHLYAFCGTNASDTG